MACASWYVYAAIAAGGKKQPGGAGLYDER